MHCSVDAKAKIVANVLFSYELVQINVRIHVKEVDNPGGGNFYWFVTEGGQTQSIFEKPKNILHLGNFRPQRYTKPKNILKLGHL